MRGTPRILRYICGSRVCKNAQVRTIRREGRSTRSEPSETARRAPTQGAPDDDTVHAPWRQGEDVDKVTGGEPADGSDPKEPSVKGGLGKVERASASRSRTSNPLIFSWLRRPSRPTARDQASTGSDASFDEVSISDASGWALLNQGARTCPMSSRHSAGIGRPSSSRRNQSTTVSTSAFAPLNATRIAFRTFAAASAATRFSKTAAYGFFDIHQTTRKRVLLGAARRLFVATSVPIPSASESEGVVWTAIGPREYPLSSSVCRVDKPGDRCTREQIRDERGRLLRRGDDDGLARALDPLPRLPLPEILPRLREDPLLDRRGFLLHGMSERPAARGRNAEGVLVPPDVPVGPTPP